MDADRRIGRVAHAALTTTGVALLALYLGVFAVRNASLQGDLRTYRTAAEAWQRGLDPYAPGTLAAVAGRATEPFVYPLVTLAAFRPLAMLPPHAAQTAWMALGLALLVALVVVWRRLAPHVGILPLALVAVFGWNASALWALRTGNAELVECALVWAGLACFVAGPRRAFAVLVVAAACFKLLPAAFLLLLFVPAHDGARHPRLFVASVVVLATLVLAPAALRPGTGALAFLAHVPDARTLGEANPGALACLTVLANMAGFGAYATAAATGTWIAFVLGMAGASASLLRRASDARDARTWAMAAAFLYVLLEPRPMAYGFVMLAPASLYFTRSRRTALLLALGVSAQGLLGVAGHASGAIAYVYAPALLAALLWLRIVTGAPRTTPDAEPAAAIDLARAA